MVYEFNGSACEGYTVTLPLRDPHQTRGDTSQLTDQQTTTFEDAEGKTFSFVTKSFIDQNLDKETARHRHARPARASRSRSTSPSTKSIDLRRRSSRRSIWSI